MEEYLCRNKLNKEYSSVLRIKNKIEDILNDIAIFLERMFFYLKITKYLKIYKVTKKKKIYYTVENNSHFYRVVWRYRGPPPDRKELIW